MGDREEDLGITAGMRVCDGDESKLHAGANHTHAAGSVTGAHLECGDGQLQLRIVRGELRMDARG